jgi:hypothetical protein
MLFRTPYLAKKGGASILANLQSTSKHGAIEDSEITTFQGHEFKMTAYIEARPAKVISLVLQCLSESLEDFASN